MAAIAAPIVCLAPFATKAFTVDDLLFVWGARQIHAHPLDFFGSWALWGCTQRPMYAINQNPPGAAYYTALATSFLPESELTLHLAFLLGACAASLGTYVLARRFCSMPAMAALLAILNPVFLVSSSTVMCDTLMVAFYVWAIVLWMRGIEKRSYWPLIASGILIACATLTKYFGLTLIPLLLLYTLLRRTGPRQAWLALLIPIAATAAYEWYTRRLYGQGMLQTAIQFGMSMALPPAWHDKSLLAPKTLIGIAFLGGCFAGIVFFAPLLWRLRTCITGVVCAAACLAILFAVSGSCRDYVYDQTGVHWLFLAQWAVFMTAGLLLGALALTDLWRARDADSLLLFMWAAGTFVFATMVNWTVNGRTILPLAPALGILLARRLEYRIASRKRVTPRLVMAAFVPSACIALCVLWGDCAWANTARTAVQALAEEFQARPGTVWYQGQWGFQYYAEAAGWKPLTTEQPAVFLNDVLVSPENSVNCMDAFRAVIRPIDTRFFPACGWVSTMHQATGAGFYSHYWGPLPFVFGATPPEKYVVYRFLFP